MSVPVSNDEAEVYWPHVYRADGDIPFTYDGNQAYISDGVDKVIGTYEPFEGLKCVRKIINMETNETLRHNQKQKLIQEVKILHFARHHHVVRLIHAYFLEDDPEKIKFSVIMDRAHSNLQYYLRPGRRPDSGWFGCLIGVVDYVHSLGIRHRDIKPENILVKDGKVLLADFGLSKMGLGKTMPTTYRHRNAAKTPEYCAPEVEEGSTRGRSADIFSLGAVFLEMLLAHSYPNGLLRLREGMKPSTRGIPSYAKSVDYIHLWMVENLHLVGWQNDILSLCRKMLHADRYQRPQADAVNSDLSCLSASHEPIICRCTGDLPQSRSQRLVEACRKSAEAEVENVLKEGADPNTPNAIHQAAARGSVNIVRTLLQNGAQVDTPSPTGQTALQCAARGGSLEIVQLLLEHGANVNSKDENEQTALQGAAGQGYESIVKLLLESGADIDATDLDGDDALDFAERRHHSNVIDLLENHLGTT